MTDPTTPDLYPGLPGVALTARNATLPDLVEILRGQHAAKLDVVAPARDLHAEGGMVVVRGATEPRLSLDGVTAGDVWLRPTALAGGQVADKLGIPVTLPLGAAPPPMMSFPPLPGTVWLRVIALSQARSGSGGR